MSGVRERVARFWFFQIDPFVLGLYRVLLGGFALLFLLMLAPTWRQYLGPDSLSFYPVLDWSAYRPFYPLIRFVETGLGMWAFWAVSVTAAALLTLGLWTRAATVGLWLCMVSLFYGSRVANGEEQVLCVLLFFSIFLPLDRSWRLSQLVDRELRREMFDATAKVPVYTLTLLQVHFLTIYLISIPAKLLAGNAWIDGTTVYYGMMALNYPRWPGLEVFAWGNGFFSRVLTWGTLVAEILFPLAIWFRGWRVLSALALIGLHVSLAVLLEGIMLFNGAMIVALVLFLPSRRTREWLRMRLYGSATPGRTSRRP
ncbi:MAG: hypothetical protein GY716_00310 [bacterium]|nr:hypothetical protein [bacterium]